MGVVVVFFHSVVRRETALRYGQFLQHQRRRLA
jgi:hypothetical protein